MEVACVVQLIQDKLGHSGKPNFISCYFDLKHIFPNILYCVVATNYPENTKRSTVARDGSSGGAGGARAILLLDIQ
jgi:hypothetical protein